MACCVLWIPNLGEGLELRETRIEQHNIADVGVATIDAEIDPDTHKITIRYLYAGAEQEIVLAPFKPSKDCFLYYTIASRTETDSTLSRTLDEKFHVGLYHAIKRFFHLHTHHSSDEDSILHARFFSDEKAYQEAEKSDAEYYIEEYIKKFSIFNTNLDEWLEQIAEKESTELKKVLYYLNIYSAYKRIIDRFCRYDGEYLYYQCLRQSVAQVLKNASYYDRKIASIDREIQIKRHRIESAFSHTSSIIGTNISTVGLVISIVGIILSIFATCSDGNEERYDVLQEELKEARQDIRLHKEQLQNQLIYSTASFQKEIDSFSVEIQRTDSIMEELGKQHQVMIRQLSR